LYWTQTRVAVVALLRSRGPMTAPEVRDAAEKGEVELRPSSVRRILSDAHSAGILKKRGQSYYPAQDPETGEELLLELVTKTEAAHLQELRGAS